MGTVEEIRERTLRTQIGRNPAKYRVFVFAMKSGRLLLPSDRMELLLNSYAGFHRIDDVVDGDLPLPRCYASAEEYVLDRKAGVIGKARLYDDADVLLRAAIECRDGLDLGDEVQDILQSLLFDAQRRDKGIIFSREELYNNFHLCDIRGAIKGALKVFNEDPDKVQNISYLGKASRIYYSLRDMEEDIAAGYVNIPYEDISRFEIPEKELLVRPGKHFDRYAPQIRNWMDHEARRGSAFIQEHRRQMKSIRFHPVGRLALSLLFQAPAERYFNMVLAGKDSRGAM